MNYHFIAIGGAVMHNLALELYALGNTVTGSDDEIFDPALARLKNAGICPTEFGWFPDKISHAIDAVILGMHARKDNPELIAAQQLGLTIYSFPEFIYEHAKNKKRVVIGGSHGKTTSTAMLMHILQHQQLSFDYLVGSQLAGFERMVKLSNAPLMIIEGDEYLTSALHPVPKFHVYKPQLAMLTGIAWDHINVFPTFENYVHQFQLFLNSIAENGTCFYYEDDNELCNLKAPKNVAYFPYNHPNYEVKNNQTYLPEYDIYLQIFGKHNIENAAGVVQLAKQLGISEKDAWQALASFEGTAKRMEKIFENNFNVVYKDFAHSPSKVKATVNALREFYPNNKIIAVLELHTYSSLNPQFMPMYAGTLDAATNRIIFYENHVFELKKMAIPSAGEIKTRIPNTIIINEKNELENTIKKIKGTAQEKTVFVMMSSGNFAGLDWEIFK